MDEEKAYFKWLTSSINLSSKTSQYSNLLATLFEIPFFPRLQLDEDRVSDGLHLRELFCSTNKVHLYSLKDRPVSVLEMMAALALRGEIHIMSDSVYGDRTGKWFWSMIHSLGLDKFDDEHFDVYAVYSKIHDFENGNYDRSGKGGLFTLKNHEEDARELDIWQQMSYWFTDYLDERGFFKFDDHLNDI